MHTRRWLLVAILLSYLVPRMYAESSTTDSECWQLLDQANTQLTRLSELLQTYKSASEQQSAVVEETVQKAIEKATTPLLVRIADQEDRVRRLRTSLGVGITVAGVVGFLAGIITTLLVGK